MDSQNDNVEINEHGFYQDLNNYRHFALVVTDDEVGGIQQIRCDDGLRQPYKHQQVFDINAQRGKIKTS